jgi:hypothetical protein
MSTVNAYIQKIRAPFAEELKDPVTAHLVVGMMVTEDDANPIPVLESLFNRTLYVRSHGKNVSLVDMITSGFYGPYNRHKYPNALAEVAGSPHLQMVLNDAINQVLAGSNIIQGYTDQGLPTDPNGWRTPRMWIHGEVFNDWAGGPGGPAGAEAWRQDFLAKAQNLSVA